MSASSPSFEILRHDYFVDIFRAHHYFVGPDTFFCKTGIAEKFNRMIVRGKYGRLDFFESPLLRPIYRVSQHLRADTLTPKLFPQMHPEMKSAGCFLSLSVVCLEAGKAADDLDTGSGNDEQIPDPVQIPDIIKLGRYSLPVLFHKDITPLPRAGTNGIDDLARVFGLSGPDRNLFSRPGGKPPYLFHIIPLY
jgi:hypothetical protein